MSVSNSIRTAFLRALGGQLYAQLGSTPRATAQELLMQRTVVYAKEANDGAANTATSETAIFEAQQPCRVTSITFVPSAGVTADATNYATLLVDKRDGAGGAATNLATFATDTVTTDDLTAFVPKDLTLTATTADLTLSAGNVLTIEITKAAAGVVIPRGAWVITYVDE